MQLIALVCLCVILIWFYIFLNRYKEYGGNVFLNPILYLSGTSILYLLLPIIVIYGLKVNNPMLEYSSGSDHLNSLISLYTVSVFVFFYWISIDNKNKPIVQKSINLNFIYAILMLVCIYFVHLSMAYKDVLDNIIFREDKYKFFNDVIMTANPKILLLSKISGLLIAFCFFFKKKLWVVLFAIPFLYFDTLIKGRSITLYSMLPLLIVILFYYYRYFLLIISLIISMLGLMSLFREVTYGNVFFTMFGEFFATRESTSFVIDRNLHDSFIHLLSNFSYSFLPSFIANKLNFYSITAYTSQLEGLINSSIGFSGNIVGEAYFYGGYWFALLNPFIISAIYLFVQKMGMDNKYKILYIIMLCSYSIWFMRSEFYVTFASLTSMFIIYICPFLLISRMKKSV